MRRAQTLGILAFLVPSGAAIACGMGSLHTGSVHMDSVHRGSVHRGSVPKLETSFIDENNTAMDKMMRAMTIKPSGDIDHDFVAMMVPHHQGAIDMAKTELRHGKNETLRRIAQEIIVTQQQEIAAMRLAVGQQLPPSTPSPTQIPGDSK